MTCNRCLDGRHIRCERHGCTCTRCWTLPQTEKNHPVNESPRRPGQRITNRIPDNVIDEALELRRQGLTYREIGAKLGWDQSGVRRALIRRGITTHVDPELRAEIRSKSLCPTCHGTGKAA